MEVLTLDVSKRKDNINAVCLYGGSLGSIKIRCELCVLAVGVVL